MVDTRVDRQPQFLVAGSAHPLQILQTGLNRIEVVELR
jgi:hypothetical protein